MIIIIADTAMMKITMTITILIIVVGKPVEEFGSESAKKIFYSW